MRQPHSVEIKKCVKFHKITIVVLFVVDVFPKGRKVAGALFELHPGLGR